jgi:hypothetical protein
MRPALVILSLLTSLALTSLGCVPKSSDDSGVVSSSISSSSSSDSSTGSTSSSACGQGAPSAGEFCFTSVSIPELRAPQAAVGGRLGEGPGVSLIVLGSLTSELTTVDFPASEPLLSAPIAVGSNPGFQLRLANFGGSPLPELVVASVGINSKLLANNNGILGAVTEFDLPGLAGDGLLVPIDIDGDGVSEVIKGTADGARIWVSEGDQWLLQEPSFEVPGCKVLWDAAVADLNGDGLQDIALIGSPGSLDEGVECDPLPLMRVTVLLATGDADLMMKVADIPTAQVSSQIAVGDFDGDTIMDLAVASDLNEGVIALKGLGDGQFAPPALVVPDGKRVLAGDFDGDGRDELVTNRYTSDALVAQVWFVDSVLEGPTLHQVEGVNAALLASADLNDDGVEDVTLKSILEPASHLAVLLSNP